MGVTHPKKCEKRLKKHFWDSKELKGGWKVGTLLNVHTKPQLPSLIWKGRDREGRALFQGQEVEKPPYLPSQLTQGVDFLIRYTTFDFLSISFKKCNFCVFGPSALPPRNWGITEFWSKFIFIRIYLILRQTEPIDRIGAISIRNEQSKWF